MSNGQVSVWVPIIVGMIGLTGVIAGQLVNAWREDLRWQRELQREDLRWLRETERENMRLRAQNAEQWRAHKLKLYSQLVRTVRSIDQLTASVAATVSVIDTFDREEPSIFSTENDLDKLEKQFEEFLEISTEVEILCSEQLRFLLRWKFFQLMFPRRIAQNKFEIDSPWPEAGYPGELTNHVRQVNDLCYQIEDLVRRELGVETSDFSLSTAPDAYPTPGGVRAKRP